MPSTPPASNDAWNPQQYDRFKAERQQPFVDLLALIQPVAHMRIVDLGCGTGELTRRLHDTMRADDTVGIDSSARMLADAPATPTCRFVHADIATYQPEHPLDLVFSNAALHWLPDHPSMLARLTRLLGSGGQLAVQMPANHDHLSHTVAAEVAQEQPFASAFDAAPSATHVLPIDAYARLLDQLGFTTQHVRLQVYVHHLPSRDDVVEWTRGTRLTDYIRRLPAELAEPFVARYRERLVPQLEDRRPYVFPFKRVLLWGRR